MGNVQIYGGKNFSQREDGSWLMYDGADWVPSLPPKEQLRQLKEEKKTSKIAAAREELIRQYAEKLEGKDVYVEAVTETVIMGKHTVDTTTHIIDAIESSGYRLEQLTSVYAEKLGLNAVTHTLVFRRV